MEALAVVALLQMPKSPRFTKPEDVDWCYKPFDLDGLRRLPAAVSAKSCNRRNGDDCRDYFEFRSSP